MARTIEPAASLDHFDSPETKARCAALRRAEAIAARVVATLGTKRTIDAFIDDEDFTEVAPAVADALLDAEETANLEDRRIGKIILDKLTKEEWRLYDRENSAQNAYALASLEAGILIGIELERVRARTSEGA